MAVYNESYTLSLFNIFQKTYIRSYKVQRTLFSLLNDNSYIFLETKTDINQ